MLRLVNQKVKKVRAHEIEKVLGDTLSRVEQKQHFAQNENEWSGGCGRLHVLGVHGYTTIASENNANKLVELET
jgi:hypothetical protein